MRTNIKNTLIFFCDFSTINMLNVIVSGVRDKINASILSIVLGEMLHSVTVSDLERGSNTF